MLENKRLGRFTIEVDTINVAPEAVRAVMASVIVIRAEMMLAHQHIEYLAICDDFDIYDGALMGVPLYEAVLNEDSGVVTWERQK